MTPSISSPALPFGDFLRQLRRRAGLTQGEFATRVGYSVAQISRLEQNQRLPTVAVVAEIFAPALDLQDAPHLAHRLVELAALARGETPPAAVRVTRTIHTVIHEEVAPDADRPPAALWPLVGREQDVDVVCRRLLTAPGRLVTLVGPPGVGKTQLSLVVAAQMRPLLRDGVWFVPLAAVNDPEFVGLAIAAALALTTPNTKTTETRLVEHLRRRETLLVLDNMEQVTACAPLLVTLLQACPGLRLLVTSTEPLRVRSEQRYQVAPLTPAASTELFIQRAQAVDPEFAVTPESAGAITEVCLRLDCLPLAIELIAARVDLLTPAAMLAQLADRRLDLLVHGPRDLEAHHSTLRAAIHRSYVLLAIPEQALLRRLGVYVGGCDLATIAALGFDESILRALLSKSLLQRVAGGSVEPRFHLLETLREFALEALSEAGEAPAARRQHATYFLALATQASTHWHSPQHQYWLERLEMEHDNLRAAMHWLLVYDAQGAQQLGAALREFWYIRGHFAEARRLLTQALAASAAPTLARGQALLAAARLAHAQDENAAGLRLVEEALPLLRQTGDQAGYAEALRTGGWIAHSAGLSWRALAMFTEALALSRLLGATALVADLHISIAQLHALDGDEAHFAVARRDFATGLELARQLDRQPSIAYALHGAASLEFMAGDNLRAIQLAQEALAIFCRLEYRRSVPLTLLLIGEAALLMGDLETARRHAQDALAQYTTLETPWGCAAAQHLYGQVACASEEWVWATVQLRASLEISWRIGDEKLCATNLAALGGVAVGEQAYARATTLLAAAHRMFDALPRFLAPGYRTANAARVATARDAIGEINFAAAWAAGQALSVADAVACGLGQLHPCGAILS